MPSFCYPPPLWSYPLRFSQEVWGLCPIAIGEVLPLNVSQPMFCLWSNVCSLPTKWVSILIMELRHSSTPLSYSFLIPLLQASPSAASCLTSRMHSTPLTVQFFFKRSAQRSLLSPPGWNAVMGLSPISSLGTILSLAVLVFNRGTPLAHLPSPWFSSPWSKGFRGRFQAFSSMGGTWTIALYVAPLRISFLPWPS